MTESHIIWHVPEEIVTLLPYIRECWSVGSPTVPGLLLAHVVNADPDAPIRCYFIHASRNGKLDIHHQPMFGRIVDPVLEPRRQTYFTQRRKIKRRARIVLMQRFKLPLPRTLRCWSILPSWLTSRI
jgi:hypothetical protein